MFRSLLLQLHLADELHARLAARRLIKDPASAPLDVKGVVGVDPELEEGQLCAVDGLGQTLDDDHNLATQQAATTACEEAISASDHNRRPLQVI